MNDTNETIWNYKGRKNMHQARFRGMVFAPTMRSMFAPLRGADIAAFKHKARCLAVRPAGGGAGSRKGLRKMYLIKTDKKGVFKAQPKHVAAAEAKV